MSYLRVIFVFYLRLYDKYEKGKQIDCAANVFLFCFVVLVMLSN